jgi:regulatory protein
MSIIISRIEPQKKKKNRYNLYTENKFLLGVSDESLVTFNLYKGQKLTTTLLNKIKQAEQVISIREQAFRFLARRPHSKKELEIKLHNKDFDVFLIKNTIKEFEEKKIIDDRIFTLSFIQDEIQFKKNGPNQIKHRLYMKGIDKTLIADIIASVYDETLRLSNCKYQAKKKYMSLKKYPLKKQRQKLAAYLRQKGFTWEMIQMSISQFVKEDDDETF